MPKKRKNRGRAKGDKGRDSIVSCDGCGRPIPRGKAIRVTRYVSFVDPQLRAELEKKGVTISKTLVTKYLCVSCAIFQGVRKVRAEEERKIVQSQAKPKIVRGEGWKPSS
ncbi:MAG: 30S ribosomal protein S26e [Candidatus Nezhaarchaeota archaeon]|nr:30S ribosomal protein S26e [Candidatus Nezhaarchaeota archaeon]MCX8142221.1 30S ribosomal protein S26e [Candidatus Nezhaarchaeota archaeon]MDW8050806.1 30S ribosomal protein S26e [Nitrososphaerota archaeon]